MDSLLVAFAIGLVIWLMMRRIVQQRARQRMAGEAEAGAAPTGQRTMRRIGTPGTVTRAQMAELRACHFEPSRHWSREEAQLILDAVSYLRAVIAEETGDDDPPIEIQNEVLGFILTDDALREAILDWSLNRRHGEEDAAEDAMPRDETYARVAEYVTELWEAEAGNG